MAMRVKEIISELVESQRDELIDTVAQFIRIPSIEGPPLSGKPFGEPVDKALNYALHLASQLGFKTRNLDGYIGYAEYGRGEELVGVLTHVDVVPEGKKEDWKFPPFGGIVQDGIVHGRGSVDDKGPLVAVLYGLKALKDAGLPVTKRARVLFGTNEESGWGGMNYYLEHEVVPSCAFSPDGMFTVVNREKGITVVALKRKFSSPQHHDITLRSLFGGTAHNVVPDYAEAVLSVEENQRATVLNLYEAFKTEHPEFDVALEEKKGEVVVRAHGEAAHAMAPEQGKNAIAQLLRFLSGLPCEGQSAMEFIRLLDSEVGLDYTGRSLDMEWHDEVSGSLTLNLGTIRGDETGAEAMLDIRSPVSYECDQVVEALQANFRDSSTEVVVKTRKEPLYVPADHPLVTTLTQVYEEVTGRKPVLHAIGGGTYARAMKNCVCFGSVYPDDEVTVHRANERVTIEDLILNAKVYGQALFALLK